MQTGFNKLMDKIQTLITTNFNDNIEYFETKHNKVFQKLSSLDTAIQNGHYQDRYELVYENDGFDVYEKSTGKYLYNKESLAHALIAQNSVNFSIDNNVFEGHVRHSFTKEEREAIHDAKPMSEYRKYISDIIDFTTENATKPKDLSTIDKFVFFGTGLGIHLEKIDEKINSKVYFIIEDDLELFRLSLFSVNYKKLANKATLVFSIFEEKDAFMESCAIFLDTASYYNHYLKFFHLLSFNEQKIEEFQQALTSQPHIRFLFNNLMLQYTQPLKYLLSDAMVLKKTLKFDHTINKKPFLVLASGPSLENNISWLQANHKRYITIAVSSSLAFLEKHNIVPNIILHIDPFEWGITSFEKLQSLEFIKDSVCFFGASTPNNIVSLIDKEKLFFFETGTSYREDALKLSTPCVGSMALQLLIVLDAKEIYLLGLDLAIDANTRKTHAGEHQAQRKLQSKNQENKEQAISYGESLFSVEGNFSSSVETTPSFYSSIYSIEYFISKLIKKTQKVYNLSNGAKFSHTIAVKTASLTDVKAPLEKNFLDYLLEFSHTNSLQTLSKRDKKIISDKISHANSLLSITQEYHLQTDDIVEYIQNIYALFAPHEAIEQYELSRVINDYLHYLSSYLYDYFNERDKTDSKDALQNLSAMLLTHLQDIITYYLNSIKRDT